MNYMGEADEMLYRQQDREDKRREFLEQRSRMGGPEAPEPCERCDGRGSVYRLEDRYEECSRCLGTGVQP